MRLRKVRFALFCFLLMCTSTFCTGKAKSPSTNSADYAVLREDLEPFRSDFNAQPDNVRAVLLVGPT